MKGNYVLVLYNSLDQIIDVGKLGKLKFKKGYYLYFGSAKGKSINLENRIKRHIRLNKQKIGKLHWHIDYLLVNKYIDIVTIFIKETQDEKECKVIENLKNKGLIDEENIVRGFGNSDCNCKGHLVYLSTEDCFKKVSKEILRLGYKIFNL